MKRPGPMVAPVTGYLAARRQAGVDLRIAGRQLLSFARFADGTGYHGPFTVSLAERWARSAAPASRLTWARRFEVLRPFSKYLVQFSDRNEVIPTGFFGTAHRRLTPHIYTDREVTDLLRAARQLPPSTGLRPLTYVPLLGLLAATGLRLSEALRLRPNDVEGALLTVRQTKFRKSRIVPVHPATAAALTRYAGARRRRFDPMSVDTFFVSDRGTPLAPRTAEGTFAGLRGTLGWAARGGHAHPRLHDLRHTFVVRALVRQAESGRSVDDVVDILSTYFGHAKVSDTYWYVSATPDLLRLAVRRFVPLETGGGS